MDSDNCSQAFSSEGVILSIDADAGFCGDDDELGDAEGLCEEGEYIWSRISNTDLVVAEVEESAASGARKDYLVADECREQLGCNALETCGLEWFMNGE